MADRVPARDFHQLMMFSLEAANDLIDEEGLDSIEELVDLTPKRCERIVDRLVKPGGGWTPEVSPTVGTVSLRGPPPT